MIRTGIGYDVHRLAKGEALILGGVTIRSEKGSVGHSDGDVITHAIVDALLGASGCGDIGTHFPSDDERWKGMSSLHFLSNTVKVIGDAEFQITNVDATVILENPRLSGYLEEMKKVLAAEMKIEPGAISVKATTTDGLGFIGQKEGIGAMAIATVTKV
ncbi:MAG: 2-C-methyl-D-erythritol 2,4-cyclodiphosphate synthase [Candidatus Marinimicrobia bacterium]|nr:2-C-methyl-D-erythritol 2,4-cyclodiphosphate synthase [Candidatus Neomarinimicrobiota bacterium]|tara:strand:+ start:94 stop:570 length:477 start_codon:yes stop_codon:yes gene_type:complete